MGHLYSIVVLWRSTASYTTKTKQETQDFCEYVYSAERDFDIHIFSTTSPIIVKILTGFKN